MRWARPAPLADYAAQRERVLALYKQASRSARSDEE